MQKSILNAPIRFAACLVAIASIGCAHAADKRSFVIPASDGYGISECLAKTSECGQVVADSWCEANGLSKATAYGPAEDITAAISSSSAPSMQPPPGSFVITCAE